MCIFAKPVREVKETRILVAPTKGNRVLTIYENYVGLFSLFWCEFGVWYLLWLKNINIMRLSLMTHRFKKLTFLGVDDPLGGMLGLTLTEQPKKEDKSPNGIFKVLTISYRLLWYHNFASLPFS